MAFNITNEITEVRLSRRQDGTLDMQFSYVETVEDTDTGKVYRGQSGVIDAERYAELGGAAKTQARSKFSAILNEALDKIPAP